MKRKTVIIAVMAPVCLILAAIFAAGWIFSSNLLHSPARCYPAHVYCGDPSNLGLEYKDIGIETSDGVALKGWLIPAANSRKLVVFVHGHSATRNAGLRYARALHDAGFNYLLCGLRGSLKDKGKAVFSMGFHEQKDIRAMVDCAVKDLKMESVGIMGFSMGASASIVAMAEDPRIRAGAFNSGFSNVRKQLADRANSRYGLPAFPFIDIVLLLASVRGSIDFDVINPEDYIGKIAPRPVFIFHSAKDPEVGIEHARLLFEKAGEPKLLWEVPWPGHTAEWNNGKEESERRIVKFFKDSM